MILAVIHYPGCINIKCVSKADTKKKEKAELDRKAVSAVGTAHEGEQENMIRWDHGTKQ